MSKNKKKISDSIKKFDCLGFKTMVQADIYQQIKKMTPEQEILYFRHNLEKSDFALLWKRLQERYGQNDNRF